MDERIYRILESVVINMGPEALNSIKKSCGAYDEKYSSGKQAEFVKDIIDKIEKDYGADTVKKVLRPCGHKCIQDDAVNAAKELYKNSDNIETFLADMNRHDIGGGKLRYEKGKIVAVYDRCYCGLPTEIADMNPLYCNCSEGWLERLFSSVFEREMEVRRVRTILDGASECVFEIA